MKRLLFNTIFALSVCNLTAQTLSIAPAEAETGGKTELVVSGSQMAAMTALQFDLTLPDGVTLDETNIVKESGASSHELAIRTLADGSRLFVLYSMNNALLANGELLRLPITVGSEAGTKEGSIYKIRTATTEAVSHAAADAVFTVTVKAEELPVTITANDITITYGEDIPILTYSIDGATLNGTPNLTTTATKTSPVGTYPIKVEKGTVMNGKATYVDGTLTITKAPLTVSAQNCERNQGEENPTFALIYSGWKNSEDESVLTVKPVATTTATKDSPAGEYVITVDGGDAQNYTFDYVNGILTVSEASAITQISTNEGEAQNYDVLGRKVNSSAKGLLIRDGKVMLVR